MSDQVTARPAICLNMIVRNEAHIVREVLDSVAPHISSWVIVDTGSDDGTQDLIRDHMAHLGIPGELHERPWRNFGHNRTDALSLARGHGDYTWVIDADDVVVGTPDFTGLAADIYDLRYANAGGAFWRSQLFRNALTIRYEGVVHEYIVCDDPCVYERLDGDYHVEFRELGDRTASGQKHARDRDLLLAEIERNPEDARSVYYLAQSYFDLDDYPNAHKWFARRAEMQTGWDQEAYFAMYRLADSKLNLSEPWPNVLDAYLRAWEFRPVRAEPLYEIARCYRKDQRYQLGYLFAKRAAAIQFPDQEAFYVKDDIYAWHAADEQAVCASWIGKEDEAFALWRHILARPDIPDGDRQRIAGNRDACVPTMINAASTYPDEIVRRLAARDGEVVVSLDAGPDREATERALNSFLHCCTDVHRVGRFLALDAGLSPADGAKLQERYAFLEFVPPGTDVREHIDARLWLHLGQGWRFFAPENYLTWLTAVLDAEPHVSQVGINYTSAPEPEVHRTPDGSRYVLTDGPVIGPAMVDTTRPEHGGTASLDEVLCVADA